MAEAELLSQLSAILKPRTEIRESFRKFPAPEWWGGHYLEPDLALHGILKKRTAALFVEYDGYWRHGEKEGMAVDRKKNAALLDYAPAGSFVVRITHHSILKPFVQGHILWITVPPWQAGEERSLVKTLQAVLAQVASGLQKALQPSVLRRMEQVSLQMANKEWTVSEDGQEFAMEAAAQAGRNSSEEVYDYLATEGFSLRDIQLMKKVFKSRSQSIEGNLQPKLRWLLGLGLSKTQVAKAVARFPSVLRLSIEENLKPTVEWLLELGLSKMQVAKAVAGFPSILGLSIEENLKPTVEWLLELGLSKMQVAKAVAGFPQILGYSIEQNLKPTVEWLLELGLSKMQVAKAVAGFPSILGLSIEQNLKPTVEWLLELGLSKMQVAKAVAGFPQILGYSIEQNLKPTVEWLLELGLSKMQVAKAVAGFPSILGYSIEQNLKPTVEWLLELGLSKMQVAKAVAGFSQILGYSIEQNLKPTVEWLLELGLSKMQVAKAVAGSPKILGLSIEENLKPTVEWLLGLGLNKTQVAKAVASYPPILWLSIEKNLKPKAALLRSYLSLELGSLEDFANWVASCPRVFSYRHSRLSERLTMLAGQNETARLVSTHMLPDAKFFDMYGSPVSLKSDFAHGQMHM